MSVLVAGDANLDLVLRGDVRPRFGQAEQELDGADLVLGSSAGICASGLARLGVDVALVARVGDDLFGTRTRDLLAGNGVGTGEVRTVPGASGLSVILSADDRAILTLPGAMAGLEPREVLDALERLRPRHLHVASFFLLPALASGLAEVLAQAHRLGVTTSLDTNWDPSGRWALVAECLPHLDLLFPNAAEAVHLAGALGAAAGEPAASASALAAYGPTVVVKDGAFGGFAVSGDRLVRAPALPVEAIDTTGAGDSFDAGYLAAWLDGRPVAECLAWALTCGSLSTLGVGGTGAQATREQVLVALG